VRALALLAAMAFVLAAAPPPRVAAQAPSPPFVLHWRYVLSIPDPLSGNVHVQVNVSGAKGAITQMSFTTAGHLEPVTNVTGGPDTPVSTTGSGFSFPVDGDEAFAYDVRVERPAFDDGTQRLAHVGTDFALFKAESLTLEYRYTYYEGDTFTNETTVGIDPPGGWDEAAPWNETAPHEYALPPGQTLPRGYVAMGPFQARVDKVVAGKFVHYVRLGSPAPYDAQLFDLIDKITPYYAAVYGPGVDRDILIVNAPDPMFHGGLGGTDSFFVYDQADIRTVAHEYAHVFQLFGSIEDAGKATVWLNEGDADYHSAMALYAADVWAPQNVNDFFTAATHDASDPSTAGGLLPEATYGTPLEAFAYHKGLLVLRALDERMRADSGGQLSLADLLQDLNRIHGDPTAPASAVPVTNREIETEAERLLGENLSDFFAAYVTGTQWPIPFAPFAPAGQLAAATIALDPPRAAAGSTVQASISVTNDGTERINRVVDLRVDGARAASFNVTLDVGATQQIVFPLIASPVPGDHAVTMLGANATYHTLTPANVTLDRAGFSPATVRAGERASLLVFLRNAGEDAGAVQAILATANGSVIAQSPVTALDGGESQTLTLPFEQDAPGPANLTLTLATPRGNATVPLFVDVQPPLSSGGGSGLVPGAAGDRGTPVGTWLALAALVGAAAAWRRRRP
jgi:hypothetical protein